VKYIYLSAAEADIRRLHAFLDEKNPAAAAEAVRTIERSAALLLTNPFMGKRIGNSWRQLVVRFGRGAYIMHYRVEEDLIVVTRIWHSRENRN